MKVKYFISTSFKRHESARRGDFDDMSLMTESHIIENHPFEWLKQCKEKYTDGCYEILWWKELTEEEVKLAEKLEI